MQFLLILTHNCELYKGIKLLWYAFFFRGRTVYDNICSDIRPKSNLFKAQSLFLKGNFVGFFLFFFHFSNTSTRKFGIYSSRSVSRQAPWFTLPKITKITDTGKNHLIGQMRNFSLKTAFFPPGVMVLLVHIGVMFFSLLLSFHCKCWPLALQSCVSIQMFILSFNAAEFSFVFFSILSISKQKLYQFSYGSLNVNHTLLLQKRMCYCLSRT